MIIQDYLIIFEAAVILSVILIYKSRIRGKRQNLLFYLNKFFYKNDAKFKNINNKNISLSYKKIFETKEFGFYLFRLRRIRPHKHLRSSAILYILNGRGIMHMLGRRIDAKRGTIVTVPANKVHAWKIIRTMEYIELITPSLKATQEGGDTIWAEDYDKYYN